MAQISGDANANAEFDFDPTNKVVGIIDDPGDAMVALRDLGAAGFTANEIEVVMREEGAQQIDATGKGHEASIHIVPATQKPPSYYDAPVIVRRVEEEVRAGHYVIGVVANESEARERAVDILKSHGGHFINFYGRWAAEGLKP